MEDTITTHGEDLDMDDDGRELLLDPDGPYQVPEGKIYVHNHVHPPSLAPGSRGARAWLAPAGDDRCVKCDCGFAPEIRDHYVVDHDYDPDHDQPSIRVARAVDMVQSGHLEMPEAVQAAGISMVQIDDQWSDDPIKPPTAWWVDIAEYGTVEIETEIGTVWRENRYLGEELRITRVLGFREDLTEADDQTPDVPIKLTPEQSEAALTAIEIRLEALNLDLLNGIVHSLIRDTELIRGRTGGGLLDDWQPIPSAERRERLQRSLARRGLTFPAIDDDHEVKVVTLPAVGVGDDEDDEYANGLEPGDFFISAEYGDLHRYEGGGTSSTIASGSELPFDTHDGQRVADIMAGVGAATLNDLFERIPDTPEEQASRIARGKVQVTEAVHRWIAENSAEASPVDQCGHPLTLEGEAQAQLDRENAEAAADPRGPKEYWREKSVGHDLYGADSHIMTNEDFEREWSEAHDFTDHEDQLRSMQEEAQRYPRGPKAYWREKLVGPGRQQVSHEDFEALWENAHYDEDEPPRRLAGFEFLWDDDRQTDEAQTRAAQNHPQGAREYWRGQRVGKLASTIDGHLLTDEEFDQSVWPLWDLDLVYFGLEEGRGEVVMAQSHIEEWISDPRTDAAIHGQLQSAGDQLAEAESAIVRAMGILPPGPHTQTLRNPDRSN